jgi:hypothetical protein
MSKAKREAHPQPFLSCGAISLEAMDTNSLKDNRLASGLIWLFSCIAFMLRCGVMSRLQRAGESPSVFQWVLLVGTGAFFLVATWGLWKSGEALRRKYAWPKPTVKP